MCVTKVSVDLMFTTSRKTRSEASNGLRKATSARSADMKEQRLKTLKGGDHERRARDQAEH